MVDTNELAQRQVKVAKVFCFSTKEVCCLCIIYIPRSSSDQNHLLNWQKSIHFLISLFQAQSKACFHLHKGRKKQSKEGFIYFIFP